MTQTFDMVCLAGADVGEPVQVDLDEAILFAQWAILLAAAYAPDGMPVAIEITPRGDGR